MLFNWVTYCICSRKKYFNQAFNSYFCVLTVKNVIKQVKTKKKDFYPRLSSRQTSPGLWSLLTLLQNKVLAYSHYG